MKKIVLGLGLILSLVGQNAIASIVDIGDTGNQFDRDALLHGGTVIWPVHGNMGGSEVLTLNAPLVNLPNQQADAVLLIERRSPLWGIAIGIEINNVVKEAFSTLEVFNNPNPTFATVLDLSDFGLLDGQSVSQITLIPLTTAAQYVPGGTDPKFGNYSDVSVVGIGQVIAAPVPVPAAFLLFAPALIGLMGTFRKVKA